MKYVIYIFSIAAVTMLIMYIGYMKERALPVELANRLYRKCCSIVLKYLGSNDHISSHEIRNLISGVTASVLWSRKRVGVTNPVQFTHVVIKGLLKEEKIEEEVSGSKKMYRLKAD